VTELEEFAAVSAHVKHLQRELKLALARRRELGDRLHAAGIAWAHLADLAGVKWPALAVGYWDRKAQGTRERA
jgi:hypothetical protein